MSVLTAPHAAHPIESPKAAAKPSTTPAGKGLHEARWGELMQELRIMQAGMQILTGFLLAMPLQPRFAEVTGVAKGSYVIAAVLLMISTALVVAPVGLARVVFSSQHLRPHVVEMGNSLAKAGQVTLALAISFVSSLLFGLVLGDAASVVAALVTMAGYAALWHGLPLLARSRGREAPKHRGAVPARQPLLRQPLFRRPEPIAVPVQRRNTIDDGSAGTTAHDDSSARPHDGSPALGSPYGQTHATVSTKADADGAVVEPARVIPLFGT